MRERSSPGIRNLFTSNERDSLTQNLNFGQMNSARQTKFQFDNIYKSVERFGGIGAAKSDINLQRAISNCSSRKRSDCSPLAVRKPSYDPCSEYDTRIKNDRGSYAILARHGIT